MIPPISDVAPVRELVCKLEAPNVVRESTNA